jgi:hypothetical protein
LGGFSSGISSSGWKGTDWLLVDFDGGKLYVTSVARKSGAIGDHVVSTSSGRGTITC